MIIRSPGRKHVALFDVHAPQNVPLDGVLGYIHDAGPDHIILGGDFGNYEFASHWNESLFKEICRSRLRKMLFREIDSQVTILKDIRRAAGSRAEIWFIPGNHEAWIWYACLHHRIVETCRDFESITYKTDIAKWLDDGLRELLDRLLDAKSHRMRVLRFNEPLRIGKIVYLHGHQFGTGSLNNTTCKRWPHVNLVFGHRHQHEVAPVHNQADPHKFYEHVCVPALSKLAPGYEKDKSSRHSNGFWVADITKDGMFDGRVRKVFNGKLVQSQ